MDPRIPSLLRFHDACKGLSDEEIEAISIEAEVIHTDAGDVIHRVGQPLNSLFLVAQGRLKMMAQLPGGNHRTIRYVAAGDQFGALLLISEDEFPVQVEVAEKAILLRIDKEVAKRLADDFPVWRRNLIRKLGVGIQDSMIRQRKRSMSKIATFIHADDHTRRLVAQIAKKLADAGEKIGVLCDSNDPPYDDAIPFHSLRRPDGDYVNESDVRSIVGNWPDMQRIFIVVDQVHPREKLIRLVELTDALFCLSTTANSDSAIADLKDVLARAPSWKNKAHFVWVLGENEQVAPFVPELQKLIERDFKIQLPAPDMITRGHTQGIDRIVHYLRGVNIGIALSGGAAHGMAHLGVLKALEESSITIDTLTGTSAGVLTGLIYCAGYSPDFGIESFTKGLDPGSFYKMLPKGEGIYMVRQFRNKTWDGMLRPFVHDWRLEQYPIPIHTITTDLISAKSIVRSTGDGIHALLESINLPIISPPICRDGMLLVDGGILNNLPADVLVRLGCNMIIGVDVSAHIEHRVGNNSPDTPTENMKSPGAMTTLMRCLSVQAHGLSEIGANSADVIIAPDVSRFDLAAFTKTPEMAEIGYQATMDAVPQIREILNRLDKQLFPK